MRLITRFTGVPVDVITGAYRLSNVDWNLVGICYTGGYDILNSIPVMVDPCCLILATMADRNIIDNILIFVIVAIGDTNVEVMRHALSMLTLRR